MTHEHDWDYTYIETGDLVQGGQYVVIRRACLKCPKKQKSIVDIGDEYWRDDNE